MMMRGMVMMVVIRSTEAVVIRANTRLWVTHGLGHDSHPTSRSHHGRHAHQT